MKNNILLFENKTLFQFLLLQFSQLALFFGLFYAFFPRLFQEQLERGVFLILSAFLFMHLFASFFEFFFHRYILHLKLIPLLKIFADKHAHHHSLTPVRKVAQGGQLRVENTFPIVLDAQRPHSVFPWYALMAFAITFTPFIFVAQWLFPGLPMLFGGYATVFVSYVGYEVIHAYEHRSYEAWWKKKFEEKYSGPLWKKFYSFHLTHHANPRCNEAIGGFLGLPIPDLILGTYKTPSQLLIDGTVVSEEDFSAPRASLLVRFLDRAFGVA